MTAVERHEDELRVAVEEGPGRAARRDAALAGRAPHADAAGHLRRPGRRRRPPLPRRPGVNAPAGSFYALGPSEALGLGVAGGLRIGLAPYTDADDVQRLLDGLRAFLAS